jgi:protein-S-isoprenylcysteine O-methyltransferase Ste14
MAMSLIPAFEIGLWNAWILMVWSVIQSFGFILLNKDVYKKAGNPPDLKLSRAYKIVSFLSMPLWLSAIAYSIFLPLQLGTLWFATGLTIYLFGLIMSISATVSFATTPINEPVTKGAYHYSRHPLYVALVLTYLGVGIASASWVFIIVAVLWASMLGVSVKDEELYCLGKYGAAYHDYMNRTPRWFGIPKAIKAK